MIWVEIISILKSVKTYKLFDDSPSLGIFRVVDRWFALVQVALRCEIICGWDWSDWRLSTTEYIDISIVIVVGGWRKKSHRCWSTILVWCVLGYTIEAGVDKGRFTVGATDLSSCPTLRQDVGVATMLCQLLLLVLVYLDVSWSGNLCSKGFRHHSWCSGLSISQAVTRDGTLRFTLRKDTIGLTRHYRRLAHDSLVARLTWWTTYFVSWVNNILLKLSTCYLLQVLANCVRQ